MKEGKNVDELNEIDLDDRYPDGYFDHYIAMFQSEVNTKGFEEHANTYLLIEGSEGLRGLFEEIELIEKNNDLIFFVNVVRDYGIEGLDLENLMELVKVTKEIYMKNS